jgi:hypothetical protein
MSAMAAKPSPTERGLAMVGVRPYLDGPLPAKEDGMLVVPAGVAEALRQWVRRAHIEITYLPRDNEKRTKLVQAVYVTETFVRAARHGAVYLPHPRVTCTQIGFLLNMIELNQDIRPSAVRRRELDLVQPWLKTWRASMAASANTPSISTARLQRPTRPAPFQLRFPSSLLNRLFTRLTLGIFLAAVLICVPSTYLDFP